MGRFCWKTPFAHTLSYNDFTVIESRIISNGEDVELVLGYTIIPVTST